MSRGIFDDIRLFLRRHLTPAVMYILLINVAVLLFQFIVLNLLGLNRPFILLFGHVASRSYEVWRFVSYMFLHGGGMHLLFNMLALWFFGPRLESRWGTKGFLNFYFFCGIGAALVHTIFTLALSSVSGGINPAIPLIGASGAIYGILLAYALYWPNQVVYLNFFIPVKIKYLVIIFGVLEFLGTISGSMGDVSHITHLGGLLAAFIYLKGFRKIFRGGWPFKGGRRRPKKMVKRYYRDKDGKIYIEFEEE